MKYNSFINQVLKGASNIATEKFGKVSSIVKENDNNQVLTEADTAIGNFIVDEIKKQYPAHNIIDEESGVLDNKSECTWVVDPIDGTSNFANGLPFYGIMIGLLNKGLPIAGGIAIPYFDEMYTAEKGEGAFCNGQRITVTSSPDLLSELVAYGIDGHQEDPGMTYEESKLLAEIILHIRNLRTSNSVYDIMMVASGKYGGYLNRTTKIWDNVAPQIVIEEAGGIYTDFWGKPIDYTNPLEKATQNFTVCAAPSLLHKQLQQIIHR